MKLYVKNITREPKDTLYIFLRKVLRLDGSDYVRTTVNSTYFNSKFTNQQCISGKHRSFDDLVFICKTYFRVSDKAVAKVIKRILDENVRIKFVFCDTAKKWILHHDLYKSLIIEYCFTYNKSDYKTEEYGEGKYSFDDIITLMGLTKEDVKINN